MSFQFFLDCGFVPVFFNADSVTNEKDKYIGIGSRLTYKLTETLQSESTDRDFEMICQNDGVWSSTTTGIFCIYTLDFNLA